VNLHQAERGEGTLSRWRAIRPWLERTSVRLALDVGCNRGFFTLSLACSGVPTIGVEADPPTYRTALYAIRKAGIEDAGMLLMTLTPKNICALPAADGVLFLSLWHHFVRRYGLENATAMLSTLWERTGKVLFFDTGEAEMPDSYGLPAMTPNPKDWLTEYLVKVCTGGDIVHLGTHEAFAPDGGTCERNLFVAVRPRNR
jgi:hypothetical protein